MKKHLLVIISLIFMVLSFFTFNGSVVSSDNNNDNSSYLFVQLLKPERPKAHYPTIREATAMRSPCTMSKE